MEKRATFTETRQLTRMLFPEAAEMWLQTRKAYISPKTFHEYNLNLKPLSLFFGQFRPLEITADLIREYQDLRLQKCGPYAINHECSVLQQILKRVGHWPTIADQYQPLPLPKTECGRALSEDEKARLFETAQQDPNWEAAYLFATISINTSAGPKETATLRLKDIDLEREVIRIQPHGAKNTFRIRTIPLNAESLGAVRAAITRANQLGSTKPDQYLFPFRLKRNHFDPNRHQTTFKTAWNKLRTAAGIANFRMYDLRHHAITTLLENPDVSEETVECIAGHISRRMKKRYSHVRIEAMRAATAGLSLTRGPAGPVLSNEHVTEMLATLPAEVVSAKIKISRCAFDVSVEGLKQLAAASVPKEVILAMVKAS